MVSVYDLQIDVHNEAEMARHGVTPIEVLQVLDDDPRYFRNKKGHEAPYVMVGRTYGGRILTVPLAPTPVDGMWRPATAFDAGPHELARYRR